MMADDSDDDGKIVQFPLTAQERRAMRKLQQDRERQRLVNVFVDGDKALFRDSNGDVFADLNVDGHRETWPIRSMEFRGAYIAYLQRQLDRLVSEGSVLAVGVKHAMAKSAINNVLNEYEIRASSSTTPVRDVHVRVAEHEDAFYIDLCNPNWEAIRVTAGGWSIVESPPVRFRRPAACDRSRIPSAAGRSRRCGRSST